MSRHSDKVAELDELLDRASYTLTSARTAGLDRTSELRAALKRLRGLVADADALAASVDAERREAED